MSKEIAFSCRDLLDSVTQSFVCLLETNRFLSQSPVPPSVSPPLMVADGSDQKG